MKSIEMPGVQIGMGATIACRDRNPATVIGIDMVKGIIGVQLDTAIPLNQVQYGEQPEYAFEPNPKGATYSFRFRKGKWEEVRFNRDSGRWVLFNCYNHLILGERDKYFDPHF